MDRAITLPQLSQIWSEYIEFRRPQVSPSTYARDYAKITRRIEMMLSSNPEMSNAQQVRQWLLAKYANETARRTLVQFQAAARWAVFNDELLVNPFEGLARYLTSRRKPKNEYAAFTLDERDAIIHAFEQIDPFYATWPKFIFATGCRLEEAAALRWEHVASNFREILIQEAEPIDTRIRQATKNYKTTRFPCNARLQSLLRGMKPNRCDPTARLFYGKRKSRFDYKNFQNRHWRPLVERLVDEGAIAFYLPQKNMRHTFLTHAVDRLKVQDVSYLCRVSEDVLNKHYVGRSRVIEIPEF
ncbi:MAG: site-specific integrase [Cyanobacteria bacterium J06648_10]